MSISSTLLFWPVLVLASATCGVPVLVLARADAAPPAPRAAKGPHTCPGSSGKGTSHSPPKPKHEPPEHHSAYRLDYAITRQEESGASLYSGRFDLMESRPLEVSEMGPSVELKTNPNDKAPRPRMSGPGYKLKLSTHDAANGRVLVDIVYEEGTPNGGRVRLQTTAVAKPGEPGVARLDWPGGGRDIQFKLEKTGTI
jgi:hypothetical protein